MFFIAAKVGFAGCLGLAATLASRTVVKSGMRTLGVAVALLIVNFTPLMGLHGWSGSAALTMTQVVFCAGLALLIVGGARVGWQRFHRVVA